VYNQSSALKSSCLSACEVWTSLFHWRARLIFFEKRLRGTWKNPKNERGYLTSASSVELIKERNTKNEKRESCIAGDISPVVVGSNPTPRTRISIITPYLAKISSIQGL
jgi:hypothetical protein